ncbi:hypothetical protein ABH936_002640 [Dermacoccus sp. GAS27A]
MIDFGLADAAIAAHFDRALLVTQDPITELAEHLDAIERVPASAGLYRLQEGLADGPLRLDQVLFFEAEASVGSLEQPPGAQMSRPLSVRQSSCTSPGNSEIEVGVSTHKLLVIGRPLSTTGRV